MSDAIPNSIVLNHLAEKDLILCTIALYYSQWIVLQTLSEKIIGDYKSKLKQNTKTGISLDSIILYETKFLHFLSKKRLGIQNYNSDSDELLMEENLDGTCPWISECIKIENAAIFMGIGLYNECILRLESVRFKELDDFWTMRLCTLKGTCWQALGNYKKSAETALLQKKISDRNTLNYFQFIFARRQLSLSIESEDLIAAHRIVDHWLPHAKRSASKITYALFLQEQLRLAILEDDQILIFNIFSTLESLVDNSNISRHILTLIEERCEINLKREEPEKALFLLKEHLWDSQLRGDLAGQCVVHFFIARALLIKNNLREANQALQNSISIAERQNYRKTLMRSLFLSAGIHWRLKELETAARILERAGNEAIRLALPLHIECFNVSKSSINNGYLPIKPLFESQIKTGSIAQIKYLLKSLGVTGAQNLSVQVGKTVTVFDSVFAYLDSTLIADSLELRYHKIKMRYFFESALPLRIVTFKGTLKPAQKISAREQQILDLFVQKDELLSTEIVKQMKVTRQTLSPMLQKLVLLGRIRLHRRGRSSRYSIQP